PANLTIQGDPNATLDTVPMFTVSDAVLLNQPQTGFTLQNVNVGLVTGGCLFFDSCSVTPKNSTLIAPNTTPNTPLFINAHSTANVQVKVTGCTFVLQGGAVNTTLVSVTPGSGTGYKSEITNNRFVGQKNAGGDMLLAYLSDFTQVNVPNDKVEGN